VVAATPERPKTETVASQWLGRPNGQASGRRSRRIVAIADPVLSAPNPGNFGIADLTGNDKQYRDKPLPPSCSCRMASVGWPYRPSATLPAPAAENSTTVRVWQPRTAAPAHADKSKSRGQE